MTNFIKKRNLNLKKINQIDQIKMKIDLIRIKTSNLKRKNLKIEKDLKNFLSKNLKEINLFNPPRNNW